MISVLLPVFNAAATLPACLRSIAAQTVPAWECIIVDDGSSDASVEQARLAARRDARFVVVAEPHRGLVAALNTGVHHCRGRFIARMDADDLMPRDRLARQRAALERSTWAAVGGHVRFFPRRTLLPGLRAYESWLNGIDSPARVQAECFVECPIAHPALMIRREVLAAFGYRHVGWPEDYDLLLRVLAAGFEIGVVPRRLLCWRDHPARLSRTAHPYGRDAFTACKAAFLAQGLLAQRDEYVLWGYGATGRALRRALLAHGKRPAYIVEVHRGRLGNRIHGAPVVEYRELPRLRGYPIVASVAGAAARGQIRDALVAWGFREMHDFVCAA